MYFSPGEKTTYILYFYQIPLKDIFIADLPLVSYTEVIEDPLYIFSQKMIL